MRWWFSGVLCFAASARLASLATAMHCLRAFNEATHSGGTSAWLPRQAKNVVVSSLQAALPWLRSLGARILATSTCAALRKPPRPWVSFLGVLIAWAKLFLCCGVMVLRRGVRRA